MTPRPTQQTIHSLASTRNDIHDCTALGAHQPKVSRAPSFCPVSRMASPLPWSGRSRTRSLPHLRDSIIGNCARNGGAHMTLRLSDVQRDTIANRALNELMRHYIVTEEKRGLVLTKKVGDMKLFLHDLDDLHQLDFVHNQQMVKEIERLRVRSTTIEQQRESWKVRALMVEAQLLEATAKIGNNADRQNVSDVRYVSLKRYLAKRFHPDYAPGQGIEKVVRNELFREIWNEIDHLDQGVSAARAATAPSSSAA
jgi:hypothetical protein